MGLLFPRPRLRMSLRRQWQLLFTPQIDLTDEEWRSLQADIEARIWHLGMLERIFDIGRRAIRDIQHVLRDAMPRPEPLTEEAMLAVEKVDEAS